MVVTSALQQKTSLELTQYHLWRDLHMDVSHRLRIILELIIAAKV